MTSRAGGGPRVLASKARRRLVRRWHGVWDRRADGLRATYAAEDPGELPRLLSSVPFDLVGERARALAEVAGLHLDHRFDVLGSGWGRVAHGIACPGLESHRYPPGEPARADRDGAWLAGRVSRANEREARAVWRLVDPGYLPIDWQLDVKSGFRWSERTWYRDVRYGADAGADVKVPWELARMHHLPQLAVAAGLARSGAPGFAAPETYEREFRNEVLDFVTTNPPRFGVNWVTTMDVAIRVANWLVARDLFLASGAVFDEPFERVFRRSALEHARHIAGNLEWSETLRANHYLADIVGLLFAAAHLPPTPEVRGWLDLAAGELEREAHLQFHADGSGFEASTSYHRLSAEMVAWGSTLLAWLGRPSPTLAERLPAFARFIATVTKPTGRVCQVGDNDSGRFLKLVPNVRPMPTPEAVGRYANLRTAPLPVGTTYWLEDHLDHGETVALLVGASGRPYIGPFAFEWSLARGATGSMVYARPSVAVAGDATLDDATLGDPTTALGVEADARAVEDVIGAADASHRCSITIPLPRGALDGASRTALPDFGLFIVRSPRAFLAVRCGPVGQRGVGGHAHNDQLSIELAVDGVDWIADPGSYVYTPLPSRRNAYRSVTAHFVPRPTDGEPRALDHGLFRLGPGGDGRCHYWGPLGFAGEVAIGSGLLVCRIRLDGDAVAIAWASSGSDLRPSDLDEPAWRDLLPEVPFSPGYGWIEAAP